MDTDELAEKLDQRWAEKGLEASGEALEGGPVDPPEPEPEPEPEPTIEEEVQKAADRLFAGRYRSVEELEAAHSQLNQVLDRQGQEVGELRGQLREHMERTQYDISSLKEEGFEPDEDWDEWAEEEIASGDLNAIEAIAAAGEQGGPQAARYVFKKWFEADPAAASAFQVEAFGMAEAMAAAEEEQQAPPEPQGPTPVIDPRVADQVYQAVASRLPDLADFRSEMGQALLEMHPLERQRWEYRIRQDPSLGEEMIETLYMRAKSRHLEGQAQSVARGKRTDREALDTTVASATASHQGTVPPPPKSGSPNFDRAAFRREAGLAPLE